jgi:protein TonB
MAIATHDHRSDDRLVYTLFGATLLHGLVILGVTFDHGPAARSSSTPIKVVMVQPAQEEMTPEERAIFMAAADQRGAGTPEAETAGGVVTPAVPYDASGTDHGDDPRERERADEEVASERLVSPEDAERDVYAPQDASEQPDTVALSASLQQVFPATTFQRRDRLQSPSAERELEISVATRRADVADYVARWKARIEEVGTLYFPDAARQRGLRGNPVVEVAISADGGLRSIQIVRPSAHPLIDQAALRILRLAAPFDPFPDTLREQYGSLRFVYEWRFLDDATAGS